MGEIAVLYTDWKYCIRTEKCCHRERTTARVDKPEVNSGRRDWPLTVHPGQRKVQVEQVHVGW
jgi:hypothetical protein